MSRAPRLSWVPILVVGLFGSVTSSQAYVYLPVGLRGMGQMPPCTPLRIVAGGPKKVNTHLEDIHGYWGKFKVTTAAYEASGPLDTFEACLAEVPRYAGRYADEHIDAFAENRLVLGMPAEFALMLLGPPDNGYEFTFETSRDRPSGGVPSMFRSRNEARVSVRRSEYVVADLDPLARYEWGGLEVFKTQDGRIGKLKLLLLDAGDSVSLIRESEGMRIEADPKVAAKRLQSGLAQVIAEPSESDNAEYTAGMNAYRGGDFDRALETWMPLAERGHGKAQYSVGDMYYRGEGVVRDPETAAKWIRSAAQRFLPAAQYHLGYLLARGEGVDQDPVWAYFWMHTAASLGHPDAEAVRDRLAETMSAEQLGRARALVQEEGFRPPSRIHGVEPEYPELARVARLEAAVLLEARIREDGTVAVHEVVQCTRPNLGFEAAAIAAVEQWRFEPARVAGEPVPVYFTVFVRFRLL